MFEYRVSWYSVLDDHSAVVGDDGSREGWQRWARDPKQVVLDPAGEILHDIFLDPLELNAVETEVTAAESPWQAGLKQMVERSKWFSRKCWIQRSQEKSRI